MTTDYSKFVAGNPDNRPINEARHRRLRESLKQYGTLPYWPIVVRKNGDRKLHVLDGQHRLHFAKALKLPIYYIEASHEFDIAVINSTQAPWTFRDYVEKFAEAGFVDYQEALDFSSNHGIPIGKSCAMLAGTVNDSNVTASVESGNFKVGDRDYADSVAALYCPIAKMSKRINRAGLLAACMAVCRVNYFQPSRLIAAASRNVDRLEKVSGRDPMLDVFTELYNIRRSQRSQAPLGFDAKKAMLSRDPIGKTQVS